MLLSLAESGWMPDSVIRMGIRRLLAKRLRSLPQAAQRHAQELQIVELLSKDILAVETQKANEQHYEVPALFFERVLGKHLKYSCGYFESETTSLDDAEEKMLGLTCQRAELQDGQTILELGCGWGSLTVWMAENFPTAKITAVSNSHSQKRFIEQRLQQRGLSNVTVVTCDVNQFQTDLRYDRVVSVEMFEHLRNYRELFRRIAGWLLPEGKMFVHVFCHRQSSYLFETEGADNWMGRNFFTGGTMPSADLFSRFDQDLKIEQQWQVNGLHYWRTCEAWLKNLETHRLELEKLFQHQLSHTAARVALQRWRIFIMACAELFRYRDGEEWFVSHYRFRRA
jgi:cyclopropane-fatty-acyl-phospholipid synthase